MEASVTLSNASRSSNLQKRCVVITGTGIVSRLGTGLDKFRNNLLAAETGIVPISLFDAPAFPCRIAADVRDFEAARQNRNIKYFDPYQTDITMGTAIRSFGVIVSPLSTTVALMGNLTEAKGLSRLPGYRQKVLVSSIKSPVGRNFKYPDPECKLNIPKKSKSAGKIRSVLVNTRGVGSYNSSLLLEKTKI